MQNGINHTDGHQIRALCGRFKDRENLIFIGLGIYSYKRNLSYLDKRNLEASPITKKKSPLLASST
ncbi:hypothetical protein QJS10_CPB22g00046 [Acorus calamus]|uniref:Uncharacterized protein n=1 Tax=Acorus calamus TaxID=4465 RepID=A0AAV9C268_ACOCL|nr:hypothetical protein QJS10_CPB22g00046 [Acorus calamus]